MRARCCWRGVAVAALVDHRNLVGPGVAVSAGSVYRVVGTVHHIDDLIVLNALTVSFLSSPPAADNGGGGG